MRLRRAPLLGLVLLWPCMAMAQPIEGLYVAGAAGVNLLMDQPITPSPSLGALGGGDFRYNPGPAFVGGIGYGIGHGVRFELDGNELMNTLSTRNGAAVPSSARGTTQDYGAMANVLFDLDIGSRYVFPYFGAGFGYQWTGFGNLRVGMPSSGAAFTGNGTTSEIAGDGIFGFAFPIPHVPGLSVTTEYRFLGLIGPEHFGSTLATGGGAARPIGTQQVSDNLNQMLLIGMRYAFSVKPPPAPPKATPAATAAPAPAPTRSYLVFFAWDKADLTDRAKQVIAEAAAASTRVEHTRIEVNGYADRTGTAQGNQRLSRQRAQAVAAELVRDGVARETIDIEAFGETHPLVPTAPGVREPQNRRVEIIVQGGGQGGSQGDGTKS